MAAKLSILALMITFLLAAAPFGFSERRGFRATMTRRETALNFTRAALLSHERHSMLFAQLEAAAAGGVSTQTPLQRDSSGGAYDMEIAIGTPPLTLSALADTGSDLIWTKCGTCAFCEPQGSPSYYPNQSSSFSTRPCADPLCGNLESQNLAKCSRDGARCIYHYSYGDSSDAHHYTQGYLSSETFTLGGEAVEGIGFGCTTRSEGGYGTGSGLVGLGRGPLSLVSQLNAGAFSYCLNPDATASSPLLFGSQATLAGTGVQSTPLVPDATFYIVNMGSISIGSTTAPGTGTSGVIFDSGTTLTLLTDPTYTAAKSAILEQTQLPRVPDTGGFEACFQLPNDNGNSSSNPFPTMVLHFDDGADMNLDSSNYFVEVETGVVCWVVQQTSGISIIGNIMQTNFHVRYDVDQSVLSFQPADCGSV
ncbi:hypothetical protein U9M48_004078 [Paspalum notatum var. saurae]|uniref:Peptidase A1 domain-containing protein n=1 Tax=Paspalum notatum var. saurae TaxID=547442 RepID=A0AAQ3PU93_PASNO